MRVAQGGEQTGFALEAMQSLLTAKVVRQDLDRHLSAELRVARPVDLAHASSADGLDDLEFPREGTRDATSVAPISEAGSYLISTKVDVPGCQP